MSLSLAAGVVRHTSARRRVRPSGRHGSGWLLRGGETAYAARHGQARGRSSVLRSLGLDWLRPHTARA